MVFLWSGSPRPHDCPGGCTKMLEAEDALVEGAFQTDPSHNQVATVHQRTPVAVDAIRKWCAIGQLEAAGGARGHV